jgi:hypothetical protein
VTEIAKDFRAGRLKLPQLPVDEVEIPVSLQEILRRRVGLLSPTATKVAGLLAVRSRAMRLTEIADLTGLPLEHCADCTEELKELRLADMSGNMVRIAHELFRSALYQHLSDARRAVLHRSIAEHLSSLDEAVPEGEMAMHYARAGERAPAVRYGWAAATSAIESGAVAEAAYFFDLVVQNEDDAGKRAIATAELARALHLGRAIERANPILELASVRLREVGDPNRALRMDIRRVEGLAEADAAPSAELLHRLDAIKREAQDLGDWEALALGLDVELHLRHNLEDFPGISDLFRAMKQVVAEGPPEAGAVAHSGLALGILFGDPQSAMDHGRLAVELCDSRSEHRLRSLLRLLLVLQYQGRFYTAEAQSLVNEATTLAKTSGDLLLRFSLESNIAVAHLDAGNLDAAEVSMVKSTKMLGSAELDMNRFNQAINAGELALAQADFHRASEMFRLASEFVGTKTPSYAANLVRSGLGFCALEFGDLTKARRLEDELDPDPPRWYFDPTLLVSFRSRMDELRGNLRPASDRLAAATRAVQERLVLAWLKLMRNRIRILRRLGSTEAGELVTQALEVSEELRLEHRAKEFRYILGQLESSP